MPLAWTAQGRWEQLAAPRQAIHTHAVRELHTLSTAHASAPCPQVYQTPAELWEAAQREGGGGDKHLPEWYTSAVGYWDQQPPTDDGVLGGFGHVSPADVQDSRLFLRKARRGEAGGLSGAPALLGRNAAGLVAIGKVDGWLGSGEAEDGLLLPPPRRRLGQRWQRRRRARGS